MDVWAIAVAAGLIGLLVGWAWGRRRTQSRGRPVGDASVSPDAKSLVAVIGALAHELRNPLSSLKLNLQLLQEDLAERFAAESSCPVQKRLMNRLQTAVSEAGRLGRTLEEFLLFASEPKLQLQRWDLNQLVDEMLDFFTPQAVAHDLQMRAALSAEPLECMLDPTMFKQAVLNLLVNAQQAMSDGGELIVRTGKGPDGRTARLEVIDTGPGIPREQIDMIFEAYYSTKKGGTGLGLPVARRIVEAHGGRLGCSSEVGKGSDFYIDLPLAEQAGQSESKSP